MNQLIVETIARKINSLALSELAPSQGRSTYKVVKFMVKVQDIEKRVNSHVGSVIVVKVITQRSAPGMNVTREMRAWPKPGECPTGAF